MTLQLTSCIHLQSSLSISSPRQPPPSPYASLSLQSADDESVDGSGPLSSTNGGSGSLLVQQASAAAAGAEAWQRAAGSQQQQLPLTVAHEGRSGSLEDRAVSFDSWKVITCFLPAGDLQDALYALHKAHLLSNNAAMHVFTLHGNVASTWGSCAVTS